MNDVHRATIARPFSIRLTDGERATLQKKAGQVPLGAYAREILLGEKADGRTTEPPAPKLDSALLARMLALLGQSEIAVSLKTLARHAELGTLDCDAATIARLEQACAALLAMRLLLLQALGQHILSDAGGEDRTPLVAKGDGGSA